MIVLQAMFSRGTGGLEHAFLDHAGMLTDRGHELHCLVPSAAATLDELQRLAASRTDGSIVVHPIATQGLDRLLLRQRLRRLIRQTRPDVIVAHGARAVTHLAKLRPRGVPLVAITHNASARLMRATHLIALTRDLRQVYIDRGFTPDRIWQVPNALPRRHVDVERRDDVPRRPIVVGVLARLVHKKGIDIFLRGFRMALDRGLQARALIGGDGPERAHLQALASSLRLSSEIEFRGWIADTGAFFRDIDVCCVPSRDEPFGIVVLEAFAQGVPVLAAAVGGPRELIDDGVSGLLFCADDPAALAEALLDAGRPARAAALRAGAYGQIQHYQPAAVARQLEAALRRAIDSVPD
jgi:glycosyltransferase involved in cell wall biosynthesis